MYADSSFPYPKHLAYVAGNEMIFWWRIVDMLGREEGTRPPGLSVGSKAKLARHGDKQGAIIIAGARCGVGSSQLVPHTYGSHRTPNNSAFCNGSRWGAVLAFCFFL